MQRVLGLSGPPGFDWPMFWGYQAIGLGLCALLSVIVLRSLTVDRMVATFFSDDI